MTATDDYRTNVERTEVRRVMAWAWVRLVGDAIAAGCRNIWRVIFQSDIEYGELQGAMLALLWGVWFLLPWYDASAHSYPVFHALLGLLNNTYWAAIFISIGILQLCGVASKQYSIRRVGAMMALICWLFVGIFLSWSDWHAMSAPTAWAFAIGAGIGFVKIGICQRRDEQYRRLQDSGYDGTE